MSPNFKNAVENIWRPTIFCQATKFFVPWQLSFVGSSYVSQAWPIKVLKVPLIDLSGYTKNFACLRCKQARLLKMQKQEIGDYKIFIVCKRQTLLFRLSASGALVMIPFLRNNDNPTTNRTQGFPLRKWEGKPCRRGLIILLRINIIQKRTWVGGSPSWKPML